MYERNLKTNTERIIKISNINNIKQNSFNDNITYIKSLNNSISSQKLKTQNSTCSSYMRSNKTFINDENIKTDINIFKKNISKNLCATNFSMNNTKYLYKKKHVKKLNSIRNINNITTVNKKQVKYNKKIKLLNDQKTINPKLKKEFIDLTLDEYLKEQIKDINKKTYNNKENTQSLNIIHKNNNESADNKIKKNNEKKVLKNFITYNKYVSIPNKVIVKPNKTKPKLSSKTSNINLPKPKNQKMLSLNSTNRTFRVNLNNKNNNFLNHRKYNSFDESIKDIFKNKKNSINFKKDKRTKIKIINLEIDLNELISNENKNITKKKFRFSKSTKKLKDNININKFTKDFFIIPKMKKF